MHNSRDSISDQEAMSCPKKRKSFQGFSTAGEATHEVYVAAEATGEHRIAFGGFSTATEVLHEVNSEGDAARVQRVTASNDIDAGSAGILETEGAKSFISTTTKAAPADFLQNLLTIRLTVRGIKHYKENTLSLDAISLHREPHNSHGKDAVQVSSQCCDFH